MAGESWHNMACRAGGHTAYEREGDLVVEWYDHGENIAYESANLLIFDPAAQQRLALVIGAAPSSSPDELASMVAERFESFWEVADFAKAHGIPARRETDFMP